MRNKALEELDNCLMIKNIPTGITHLLKLLTEEDLDIDDLIDKLKSFPVICVRLVMVANSAWAAPRTEITDVKKACLQLGLKMVKSISIALLVSQQFNAQKCKGFDERKFWLSSLITSELMSQMASKSKDSDVSAGTAHLVGLIHNLGVLALAEILPDKTGQAVILSQNSEVSFDGALQDILGISFLEATQTILINWGLPADMANAYIKSAHDTAYLPLLNQALSVKNNINLAAVPFTLEHEIEDATESTIVERIIGKSSYYDDLCALYCR